MLGQGTARRRLRRSGSLALALSLLLASCGRKSDEPKSDDSPATATPIPADAAPPPNPGLVYFAISREGIVELEAGVFRRVIASQGRIDDLDVGPDGTVYAVADAQIFRAPKGATGDTGELIGNRRAPGVARRIAVAPDGALWAITGKGLWRFADNEWSADESFPRPRTVVDIVASRGGRVVAAARDAAFVREADGWRAVELPDPPPEPKPAKPAPGDDDGGDTVEDDTSEDGVDEEGGSKKHTFVRSLALGADDLVYASTSSGVYLLGDTDWKQVTKTPVGALAVGANGEVIAASDTGSVLWGAGEKELASLGIAATELDAIATDSLSRVWLATDGGLIVAKRTAEPAAVYSAGSQAALPGRIVAIRVIEAPTSDAMPEITERRIGAVIGKLVGLDKKSVAGVEIELCARPDTLFRGSPCAEAPFRGASTSDAKGAFRLEGVPAGRYGFALKQDGEWIVDLTIDCCAQLFSDAEVTLKKISVP